MSAPEIQAIVREHPNSHLGDAESIHAGIAGFLNKYESLMSPPQRNFNLLKIFYYRYLAEKKLPDYFRFWFHSLRDSLLPQEELNSP